jgi:hypothetical protein
MASHLKINGARIGLIIFGACPHCRRQLGKGLIGAHLLACFGLPYRAVSFPRALDRRKRHDLGTRQVKPDYQGLLAMEVRLSHTSIHNSDLLGNEIDHTAV